MLCETFTLGSEIILLSISSAHIWYGHIAEVPHLNGDIVRSIFSTCCLPRRHLTIFYGQENMLATVWWALLPFTLGQHPFLRGEDVSYLCFFSLPEVKWLLTNPKEVPLNMNDTPTAPLLPGKR